MADFQLTVLDIAFKDACSGLAQADEFKQFFLTGATILGFLHGSLEIVFHQTGGRELPEVQQGAAFVEIEAQALEVLVSRAFLGQSEQGADLYTIGSHGFGCQHGIAGCDTAGSNQRQADGSSNGRNQAHRGCFLLAVVTTGFKAFGDNSVNASFLTFDSKCR